MKKYLVAIIIPIILVLVSCKQKPAVVQEPGPQFNNQLTVV